MAYSKIRDVRLYFKWLDAALKSGYIDNPKNLNEFIEFSYDENGRIDEWIFNHRQVRFSCSDILYCSEEGECAGSSGYRIPEYHFHFQPSSENAELEVFRLDLDRDEEVHFNPSEQRQATGNHLKNGQTPFDFSNFNCRLALLMGILYMSTKIYPLDDKLQEYYEPVLSNKKDG
ncbi:MAG: hypothetical protein AB9917_22485 [Negativicutes bacterium]